MVLLKDRKIILKSLFLVIMFLLIGVIIHVALVSVVTFFHLQLDHRFVDIQDWIYANGWFIHIVKSVLSFYIIERVLSIVNYENNGLSKIIQDFKLDINYKMPALIILMLLISSVVSFSPSLNSVNHNQIGSLLLSYFGHMTFFFSHTLFLFLLFNKMKLEKVSKIFISVSYVFLVYMTEQIFFKFQENHERLSIAFLLLLTYLCCISEKKYLNLAFAFITFFLCPFLVLFGLDLVWGSEFSPFILKSSFDLFDVFYLSAAVGLLLYLDNRGKSPAN